MTSTARPAPEPHRSPDDHRSAGPAHVVAEQVEAYDPDGRQPLGRYAATLVTYGATVGALSALAWRRRRGALPETRPFDVALLGAATFKLTRVVTKDAVTSPLRAAFTTFDGHAETPVEVNERPRGSGVRRTVGQLLSCPFCTGQWVGTGFAFGAVLAPRATRLVATTLAAIATADFLQFAYVAAEKRT